MILIDDTLISTELFDRKFCCDLKACKGACCVEGESGAPLEPEEKAEIEAAFPVIRDRLKPDSLAVIEEEGLFTVDADGSNLQPVTLARDGNNEDCSWAPDGRHLVVTSDRDGTRRLWVIDTETGWARPLTLDAVDDNGPHWSGPPRPSSNG